MSGLDVGQAGRALFGLAASILGGADLARAKVVRPYDAPVVEARMVYDESELEARRLAAEERLHAAPPIIFGVLVLVNSIGFWCLAHAVVTRLPESAPALRLLAVLP